MTAQTTSPGVRVAIIDPPVALPSGMALPPALHQRFASGGRVWFRECPIPMWVSKSWVPVWQANKLAFAKRGYTVRQNDGLWFLQQWLAGNPGNYMLTQAGVSAIDRMTSPVLPLQLPPPVELVLDPLPNGLEDLLYPYQRPAARQLFRALTHGKEEWGYPGAWDCSDMGTGKTFQALAAAVATGREVGVICPKAVIGTPPRYGNKGTGWTGAFAHFKQQPLFILNYESLRTGGRVQIKRKGTTFEWTCSVEDTVFIFDEAHNCFPYETLISTEAGLIPIGEIVHNRLKIRVKTVDKTTGKTILRNVTSHFKNPSRRLLRVTHENGRFSCTANHKIWTPQGWRRADSLEKGDQLQALRSSDIPRRKKPSQAVLRKTLLNEGSGSQYEPLQKEGSSFAIIDSQRNYSNYGAVCLSPVRSDIQSTQSEEIPLRQLMCSKIQDGNAGKKRTSSSDFGRNIADSHPRTEIGLVKAHEGQKPNAELSIRRKNEEIPARQDVLSSRRQRENDQTAGKDCGTDRPCNGICYRNSRGTQITVCKPSNKIQCGLSLPGDKTGHRNRWEKSQIEEVEIPGPPKDGDTCLSRVVSVEVLECGSGCGPECRSCRDFLYDIEVEESHCYFAEGVLVHNCKNKSLNRSLAFAALRQGIPCIFVSGTMAQSPLNMGATGIAVGLHNGTRQGYEQFLASHGCEGSGSSWKAPRGRQAAIHLAAIHRKVFPIRGARVRIKDLGDLFPDTQIICEPISTEATDLIAQAWKDAKTAIEKIDAQGGINEAQKRMMENAAYMDAWHNSERAKVSTIVTKAHEELAEDRSVAIFVNFTDVREALMRELKTRCAIFGGQNQQHRDACIADFQADRERVIICNTAAGGVGVSLHDINGDHPRTAFLLPTNNAVHLGQALGRVHRAGGKSKSRQIVLFAADTVEEQICESTRAKLSNISTLNDGDLSPPSAF